MFGKFPWKIPGNSVRLFYINSMLQRKNLCFYFFKIKENRGKFRGNFREISAIPKIPGKIFPGKFPENHDVFYSKTQCYIAKIALFMFVKARKLGENFEKLPGKISEIPKISGRTFSGKFPGNSGCFFRGNTMIQSKNHSFYFYKRKENPRKFREKFPENFTNSENSRKFSPKISRKFPENSRKIEGVFKVKCNGTERKSCFSSLKNRGKSGKFPGKFRGNFGKFRKFRKFREIFPGKCRGHFSPKSCIF